ncbi:hypothetical protein KP509_28G046800 [Ceratopteris richardii]|uniref:RING-type E3 ubiquitin transferase n=1 Tax=Ceratopteris richardii TaxID=49495 RepID=A0A8T2RE17_CERRI|nr:hypothetical protein KP509_28G046800 [Ceratopteris richardii]KAH7293889.1 hypothetical protein KP509_28G046800 [Ceratopteris richardii]
MMNTTRGEGLSTGQKVDDDDALSECLNLLETMHHHIEQTRKMTLEMTVNKVSFVMMVFHLRDLKLDLEKLIQTSDFLTMYKIRPSMRHIAEVFEDLHNFTVNWSSRSRIFLVYNSSLIVDEINKYSKKISQSLAALLVGSNLSLDFRSSIEALQEKFSSLKIFQEPVYDTLAKEISTCMNDSGCNEVQVTGLLQRLAESLQVPVFEAVKLKRELQDDLEKAESGGLPYVESLQALNDLFRSAQVLNERRRLASLESSLLPTQISPIPSSFFCPITKSIMREPVMIAEEGFTYEKSAILEWFGRGHNTCPDTGKVLQSLSLVPNLKLQQAMDEFFDHMYQAQIVYVLQAMRNQSADMSIEQAVHSLKRLTDLGSKYRQLIFSLDGVEVLLNLLKPSSADLRDVIMKILIDICTGGDAQKIAIVELGTIPLLLKFLQKDPLDKSSLQLLYELSKVPAGKLAFISQKGCMLVLATVLNSSPEKCKPQIQGLLNNLCKDNTKMIMEAARSTLLDPLVEGLTTGDETVKLELLSALLESYDLNELNSAALIEAGIIHPLLGLVQEGSSESMYASVKLLAHLSYTEQNKSALAKAGAIRILVKFLVYPVDEVKVHVTSLLSSLATDRQNADEIDSEGAVARLFTTIMECKDILLQEYSLKTLGSMAKDSRTVRNQVIELGMVPCFHALLESTELSASSRKNILVVLHHVIKDTDDIRAVAPSTEGIKHLIKELEVSDIEEKEVVFAILEALSHAKEMALVMLSNEKLFLVSVGYLEQSNLSMQESAAGLLAKFACYGIERANVKAAFSKHNVFVNLLKLIDNVSSTKITKERAAEGIYYLSSCSSNLTVPVPAALGCLAGLGFKKFQACKVHGGKCIVRETFCLVEAGAIPCLINLIKRKEANAAGWAVKALYSLIEATPNTRGGIDLIMKNDALLAVVESMGYNQDSTIVLVKMLEKIFRVRRYRVIRNLNIAKTVLMRAMASGNAEVRKQAATALMHLGEIATDTSYASTPSA